MFVWFCAAPPCFAENIATIRIDASQPIAEPVPAAYDGGSAKSSSGNFIGVNSRHLTRDGKPWLPVMGEFHFSRYPESHWEEEILKMKASGVDIVATYVIWIHHEEIAGQFDWKGQRDLRVFAQLCARHNMYLIARVGPWAHGEVRNGGFPDWLVNAGPTRVNDPAYLAHVRAWYGQIGAQLKGLLWKDGGPVVGIQLENEYSKRGPGAGEKHILMLKKLAIESGLDVPLYLITGWDNAAVPRRAVLPVYGGYPDAPWDHSLSKLPPPEVYSFRFQSRVTSNMGAIKSAGAMATPPSAPPSNVDPLPYFTAEMGGGIQDTYHRRPVVQSDDIAAMLPVMIGSGVNLYGSYMFQGGENPEGRLSPLQESQATGYPNDVPIKSYDFQAPLGEYGQERASFRKLKVFQYFLNDFGAVLAPMMVHSPDNVPKDPGDFSVPRASVRSSGDTGFIFLNNYVRNYSMPRRKAAQFEIRLPSGSLQVPRSPIDIPAGAYFIWSFNFRIDGITIRYSTAQLFDNRLEVSQGAHGCRRRSIGGSDQAMIECRETQLDESG
jgi:beta-galactosidase